MERRKHRIPHALGAALLAVCGFAVGVALIPAVPFLAAWAWWRNAR
jgi:hypothetical protein